MVSCLLLFGNTLTNITNKYIKHDISDGINAIKKNKSIKRIENTKMGEEF